MCETLMSFFMFEAVDHIYITNLKFFGCENTIFELGFIEFDSILIETIVSSLILLGCTFENNEGSIIVISAEYSNITVAQTTFSNNTVSSTLSYNFCNLKFVNSTFISNRGKLITSTMFHGISVATSSNTLMFTGCEFSYNNGLGSGVIVVVRNSDVSIKDTRFTNNSASPSLRIFNSDISIDRSVFKHNYGSAIAFRECTVYIFDSVYDSNQGRETEYGGAITAHDSNIYIHSSEFKKNVASFTGGGAIFCEASMIFFYEICTFSDNHAQQEGAIYLHRDAQYHVANGATVIIANNTASADGGGVYLGPHSRLTLHNQSTLHILENNASEHGGGVYASQLSYIIVTSKLINNNISSVILFHKNKASEGGGLYLEFNSAVYTGTCHNNSISFHENSAEYGGAVYVLSIIKGPIPECFFQSRALPHSTSTYNITIDTDPGTCSKQKDFAFDFLLNRASYSGASLFTKIFDRCSINGKLFEELKIISLLSNIQTSDIGSFQVQICYCENSIPDCAKQIPFIDIKSRDKITLDVAIVDQGNNPVDGSIKSEIRGHVLIRDDQKFHSVINGCTPIIFDIYSFKYSQQLIISPWFEQYINSLYIVTENSKRTIKLNFLACIECPIGFQKTNNDARGCDCACNRILEAYIVNCNYTRETITKKGTTAWITYLSVENTSGYLMYPYCPMDYCFPPDATVEINLNIPNGADAQCAHNRSGLLCGACSPGFSLSLGSSRCLPCDTHWPGVLIAIIISSILAGIILVASLLMLNLTVAVPGNTSWIDLLCKYCRHKSIHCQILSVCKFHSSICIMV
jgi:predicted outer membrane repeat protein